LKQSLLSLVSFSFWSPACTGAWIETVRPLMNRDSTPCRPLVRGRGLKLIRNRLKLIKLRSPACTGAWIETAAHAKTDSKLAVARLYGGVD